MIKLSSRVNKQDEASTAGEGQTIKQSVSRLLNKQRRKCEIPDLRKDEEQTNPDDNR